jgi:uncharacterized protein
MRINLPFRTLTTALLTALLLATPTLGTTRAIAQDSGSGWKAKTTRAAQSTLRDQVNAGTVTVITDGVTERYGLVTELAAELATTVGESGKVRLLPVMGTGATASIRDLLYLRGIDLGIVNADSLKFLEIEQKMPEASRRVRYVTRLLDKTVFVLGRTGTTTIEQLRGKNVAVLGRDSESHVTARTLFSLAAVDVSFVFTDWDDAITQLGAGKVEAIVALERSASALQQRLPKDIDLGLVSVPFTPALNGVYEARSLTAAEAPDIIAANGLNTVKVPTVLAVFGWRKNNNRFEYVNSFVSELLAAITRIKASGRDTLWSEVDPTVPVAGWKLYEPAAELIAAMPRGQAVRAPAAVLAAAAPVLQTVPQAAATAAPAQTVDPAAVSSSAVLALAPTAAAGSAPAAEPDSKAELARIAKKLAKPLSILATNQPNLAGADEPGGGLVLELLARSMAAVRPTGTKITDKIAWEPNRADNLAKLLKDGDIDAALPWRKPACEQSEALSAMDRDLCRDALFSQPIFQVINGFFATADGPAFDNEEAAVGHSVCVAEATDVADLDQQGRNWVKDERITLLRQPTLGDCMQRLVAKQVDWVFADEFSGRAAATAVEGAAAILMQERPVSITAWHGVVAKARPDAALLIAAIDGALAQAKASDVYAEIIARRLTGTSVGASVN